MELKQKYKYLIGTKIKQTIHITETSSKCKKHRLKGLKTYFIHN